MKSKVGAIVKSEAFHSRAGGATMNIEGTACAMSWKEEQTSIMEAGVRIVRPRRPLGWLRRLFQRFTYPPVERRHRGDPLPDGGWDDEREAFRPLRAEDAFEQMVAERGSSWRITLYSTLL